MTPPVQQGPSIDSKKAYMKRSASFGLIVGFLIQTPIWAIEPPVSTFDSLMSQRDFASAERWCKERLASSSLPTAELAQLTIALIRCQSDWALYSQDEERQQHWSAARATATQFVSQHSRHPRLLLVQLQEALSVLALGIQLRREADLQILPATGHEEARQALRESVALLSKLDRSLPNEIALARRAGRNGEQLTANDLTSLQYNVWGKLATARRHQGMTYSPGSADRVSALNESRTFARKALLQLAREDILAVEIGIELSICLRHLEDLEAAQGALKAADVERSPAAIRSLWAAENIRLRLSQQLDSANDFVRSISGQKLEPNPELELAILEVTLANWKSGGSKGDANSAKFWQAKAARDVADIEQNHGSMWGRLAEREWLQVAKKLGVGDSWELLQREALANYKGGKLDNAVQLFDRAVDVAIRSLNKEAAFELQYQSALVCQEQQRHTDAADRLIKLVESQPRSTKSPAAHLAAAWNLAQAARSSPERRSEFQRVLERHLELWPNDVTASSARLWLARVYQFDRKLAFAIQTLIEIPIGTPEFTEAIQLLAQCFPEYLASLDQSKVRDGVAQAENYFTRVISAATTSQNRNQNRHTAVLSLARIRIQFAPDNLPLSESELENMLLDESLVLEELEDTHRCLMVSRARQPDRCPQAIERILELKEPSARFMVACTEDLELAIQQIPGKHRQAIANLQIQLIDQLQPTISNLTEKQFVQVRKSRASALVAVGQLDAAIVELRALAKSRPTDGDLQERYGDLLIQAKNTESWQQALDQWRLVAIRSPVRSERWYRAKYWIAWTLIQLGRRPEAEKLIRYLEATDGLGPSSQREKFLELGRTR